MPYVFDLESDFGDMPFRDNMGQHLIEFVLGYELDLRLAHLMSVVLLPDLPDRPHICDLRFGVREKDIDKDWKVSGLDFTTEAVNKYVPVIARESVLDCLLRAIASLATNVLPAAITMETYYSWLPEKALRKYECIVDTLDRCGFKVTDAYQDGTDGKHYWLFERLAIEEDSDLV